MPPRLSQLRYTAVLLLTTVLSACVHLGTPDHRQARAQQLSHDLQQLSPKVSAAEADRLAHTAIEVSAALSRDFKPFCLPWANNALRNAGLRKRGLCYEWRDDLYPYLHELQLKTLDLHLTSAFRATPREHNGIIVTAKGQSFYDGLVLDPWRRGGRLWWGTLKQDKKHKWQPLPWALTPVVLRPYIMPQLYPRKPVLPKLY